MGLREITARDAGTPIVGHVVFVHGLGGGSDSTWTHDDGTYWPQLIAADIQNLRVWTYGYPTAIADFSREPCQPLRYQAQALRHELDGKILDKEHGWIVFVTHSMGGLLVKWLIQDYVTISRTQMSGIAIRGSGLHRVNGIVFCGVPHRGSGLAHAVDAMQTSFASLVGNCLGPVTRMLRTGTSKHIRELYPGEVGLELVHDTFVDWYKCNQNVRCIEILSLIEQLGYGRRSFLGAVFRTPVVVPRDSAHLDIGENYQVATDHRGISKPSKADSSQYGLIHGNVSKLLNKVLQSPVSSGSLLAHLRQL